MEIHDPGVSVKNVIAALAILALGCAARAEEPKKADPKPAACEKKDCCKDKKACCKDKKTADKKECCKDEKKK